MLVLGCTNHQSIIIDEVIRVTVINNNKGQVVLGIDVPEGIDVRHEDASAARQQGGEPRVTEV